MSCVCEWEYQRERGLAAGARDLDAPAVIGGYLAQEREAEPGALLARGEERLE
jgi:hypothetical protein